MTRERTRYEKGNLGGAIADCSKAIEINPQYARAYLLRGVAKLEQGRDLESQADSDITLNLVNSSASTMLEMSYKVIQARKVVP
jgi:hypothetical protein